ncbi:hypothetical protein FO519_008202 [Halicephalobus sp. NKZ332]|nr:hypothetical protein FO519_008202 [Halicephalobus sp. NKZ332]
MFAKFVLVLALAELAFGQTCLSIQGGCVLGQCPVGESCIDNVCCITDPAENCNNTADEITGFQMKKICARTCKSCNGAGTNSTGSPTGSPSGTCVDKVNPVTGISDCPQEKYLCNNPNYKTIMQQQCPKTCGFC